MGSSPRVWGQVSPSIKSGERIRIIPTRVGTSFSIRVNCASYWDHPHACGDKNLTSAVNSAFTGSSPRVWGQETVCVYIPRYFRIIPTRVGTRFAEMFESGEYTDHPHACGDKVWILTHRIQQRGSSPRVWGQGIPNCVKASFQRIIPTRVGTSIGRRCSG